MARKWPEPVERRVAGWGVGLVTEQVVKSNDPHGDQGLVWVKDMARVGVKHRMAKMFLILVFFPILLQ